MTYAEVVSTPTRTPTPDQQQRTPLGVITNSPQLAKQPNKPSSLGESYTIKPAPDDRRFREVSTQPRPAGKR